MTIDELLRGRVVEVGDCQEWSGTYTASGIPLLYLRGARLPVRRAVYQLKHGRDIPDGYVASNSCENRRCVCEEHVRAVSRTAMAERSCANTNHALRAAKIAATKRRTEAKLTAEPVAMVKESSRTNLDLAEELGVHHSLLSAIRAGKCWKDYQNPFAGLFTGLAANDTAKERRA